MPLSTVGEVLKHGFPSGLVPTEEIPEDLDVVGISPSMDIDDFAVILVSSDSFEDHAPGEKPPKWDLHFKKYSHFASPEESQGEPSPPSKPSDDTAPKSS